MWCPDCVVPESTLQGAPIPYKSCEVCPGSPQKVSNCGTVSDRSLGRPKKPSELWLFPDHSHHDGLDRTNDDVALKPYAQRVQVPMSVHTLQRKDTGIHATDQASMFSCIDPFQIPVTKTPQKRALADATSSYRHEMEQEHRRVVFTFELQDRGCICM